VRGLTELLIQSMGSIAFSPTHMPPWSCGRGKRLCFDFNPPSMQSIPFFSSSPCSSWTAVYRLNIKAFVMGFHTANYNVSPGVIRRSAGSVTASPTVSGPQDRRQLNAPTSRSPPPPFHQSNAGEHDSSWEAIPAHMKRWDSPHPVALSCCEFRDGSSRLTSNDQHTAPYLALSYLFHL